MKIKTVLTMNINAILLWKNLFLELHELILYENLHIIMIMF